MTVRRLERSALLPYAAEDVFDLVNDIERYPEHLKWCRTAEILEAGDGEIVASLALSGRGLRETLVTRNRLDPGRRIVLTLVEGPFRHFEGIWTFTPVGDGCRIHLTLDFELKSGLLGLLGAPLLNRVADALVDAFSRRARSVLRAG